MGEICEVCGREVGWPSGSCPDGACPAKWSPHCLRTGYEREKAARASLEQRLAELEGVAASRADAALLRGRAAHDAQEKVRALEQQVVELREALQRLIDATEGHYCADDDCQLEGRLTDARAALANHQQEKNK